MLQKAISLNSLAEMHQALIGGKRFINSYTPDTDRFAGEGGGSDFQLAPPWVEAPQNFIPFDETALAALPAPFLLTSEITVLTMVIPNGFDGVIKKYNLNFEGGGFVNGSGDIVWRILLDGNPIRNFSNITSEKGSIEQPRDLVGGLRVFSNQILTIRVFHAANAALNGDVIVGVQGWFYPSKGQ